MSLLRRAALQPRAELLDQGRPSQRLRPPQAADAHDHLPRLFPLPGTATIEIEARLRDTVGETLRQRGFAVEAPKWAIGGAQAIWVDWDHGTLLGGSDHRKDGCALGC